MTIRFDKNTRRFCAAICAGIFLAGASAASTWNAGSGIHDWNDAQNWDGGVPSGNGSVADFNVPLSGDLTVNLPSGDTRVGTLVLGAANGGGKITLSGGGQIVLNNNSAPVLIVQTADSLGDEIVAQIYFDRSATISNLSSSALSFEKVTGNRSYKVSLETGEVVLGGANNNGEFFMAVNGGTLVCDKPHNTRALFDVELNGGKIRMDNSWQLSYNSSAIFTINGGEFDLNGFETGVNRLMGSGGIVTSRAGELTMLDLPSNTFSEYGGLIADGSSTNIVKVRARENINGTLALSSANTFSGGMEVRGKTLAIGHPQAFGSQKTINFSNSSNIIRAQDDNDVHTAYNILMDCSDLAFGAADTGVVYYKHLIRYRDQDTAKIRFRTKAVFESSEFWHKFTTGGQGAGIFTSCVTNNSNDMRAINPQEGMIALLGDGNGVVGRHSFVIGASRAGDAHENGWPIISATLGMNGVRTFTLGRNDNQLQFGVCGGGFSAYGGPLDVTLYEVNGNTTIDWGSTPYFVEISDPNNPHNKTQLHDWHQDFSAPFVFGNRYATDTATLRNDIILKPDTNNIVNVFRGAAPIDGCFAGNLTSANAASFVKAHDGILSLAGAANSWLGRTEVLDGVLRIDGALSGTSGIFVEPDGALCGTGVVSAAQIIIDGALIAESGQGRGLAMNAAVQLNGALRVHLDGEALRVPVINGSLHIDSDTARIIIIEPPDSALLNARRHTILQNTNLTGHFTDLPESSSLYLEDGTRWTINYTASKITIGPPSIGTIIIIR